MQVPRRYVVEHGVDGNTSLQFGFGSETSILNKSFPDPSNAVLQLHGKEYFSDTSFDPSTLLKTEKFFLRSVLGINEYFVLIASNFINFTTLSRH